LKEVFGERNLMIRYIYSWACYLVGWFFWFQWGANKC